MKLPGWLVFTACVAGFAALCWDAGKRFPEEFPGVNRCQGDPARYAGREIWIIPAKVVVSDPEGYEIIHGTGGMIRVRSTTMPPVGSHIYLRGNFQRDGTLIQTAVLVDEHFALERRAVIVLSLITLLVFAWLFHRTFAWRNRAFHPR